MYLLLAIEFRVIKICFVIGLLRVVVFISFPTYYRYGSCFKTKAHSATFFSGKLNI